VIVPPAAFFGLPEWASRLILVAFVVAGAIVLLALARWLVRRLARRVATDDPAKARGRETGVRLLADAIRYVIVIAAVLAVVFVLAGGGGLGAVGGTALLAIILGFASQRLLIDVIAGFFILFENQYAVGDWIRVEPSGYSGVVEELGLRTTVIRDLNGDRMYIANGQISAVRRVPGRWRSVVVELPTRDPDALEAAVVAIARRLPTGGAPYVRPPRVAGRREAGEGIWVLRVRAEAPPSLEDEAVERFLEAVRTAAPDLLAAAPRTLTVDPDAAEGYIRTLPLP
jgi:small conductance mechanosensitive channel